MNLKTTIRTTTICALLLSLLFLSVPQLISGNIVTASVGQAVFCPNFFVNGTDTEDELELSEATCTYIRNMLSGRGIGCYYSFNDDCTYSSYCSILSTLNTYYDAAIVFSKGHRGMPYYPLLHYSLLDHYGDAVIDCADILPRTSEDNAVTFIWHCETSEQYPSSQDIYGWRGMPYCFTHDNDMEPYDDSGDKVYLGWENGSPQFETDAYGNYNYAHVAYYFWYFMCDEYWVVEALDSLSAIIFGESDYTDTPLYEWLWAYGNIEMELP